ncbi:hypothetical protein [Skermanella stibiiresistens]|nr:hypothetical protein [Skermanella stibiiresistens]
MNDDQNSGKDDAPQLLGQALTGRHLLDTPGPTGGSPGSPRFDGDTYPRVSRPPPPRRPNRRIDPRGLDQRGVDPRGLDQKGLDRQGLERASPDQRDSDQRGMADRFSSLDRPHAIPDQTAVERLAAAASAIQADNDADFDDDNDDLNSNGLISRSGCPRGWLISEAELARRFARMGCRFEDVEVDTEVDRVAVAIKPPQPARASAEGASYTSLFDLPRRPPSSQKR